MPRRGGAFLAGAAIGRRRAGSGSSSSDDGGRRRPVAKAAVAGAIIGGRRGGRRNSGSGSDSDRDDEGPQTYCMREKLLLNIGDDFNINKMSRRRGRGKPAYIANNKVMRVRETFQLQNLSRDTLYQIQERKARVRDSMAIEDHHGDKVAEIKKRAIGIVRENFVVKIRGETDWQIHGSILEHNFTVSEHGREIIKVHKAYIAPIAEHYYIDISEGVDTGLALCVVVALESMSED
ncbi:hypothetical protein SARC_01189 [Sphaeroforma arctica JP610]|uniref:Tubby C-terminal domain-containing protein n=1 Tax=Sphaeroforma arctica JP610 TaxID=667725 RepID=A0A0L0GCC7_9EUKA|nr:hypothetical protein SARC_01189 [Sphaeroforma arctica JP610]KNC86652.1 hypothetical protein SARC_01189 [Sphaeroforma arctica JP610]|eukprot:XP_014160554.1 hypothetical protein SARC_01189 [Sphaeroforma arctica JP610]